jgi:endonuclease I
MLNSTDAESDLHHLFPTRAYVNSRRSNYPFGNVDGGDKFCDDGINGPGSCIGYDYVSELKSSIFEPADQQKGNTARAMFYMLIKYKNLDDHKNTAQFTALRAWHSADPVDQKERDRNDKVEMFQHNRNPFVDCPQFVEALYQ